MSIARAHYQRTLAQAEAKKSGGDAIAAPGSLAEKMFVQLRMQIAELKGIQSRAAKIETKRAWLPDYSAYVDGVLAAGNGGQDDVLITMMLWRLDTGDFTGALEIAAYALRHDLSMPFGWTRSLSTTVVEEIAEQALRNPSPSMMEPLQTALDLTSERDMHDQARAKAYKAMGLILKDENPEQAIIDLEIALTLDPRCGVKNELVKLKKAVSAASAET